ncbi:MAG: hypothetical protein JW958_01505 [Candidatus Eisenbacteria bacterium]|nr:hypothetical protein [Candidatus Eisenbacteria bacterium]
MVDEADPVLVAALGNHVLWIVSTDEEEGRTLAESYGVSGIPAFILMNPAGEVVDRWSGFGGSEKWAERLAEAVSDPTPAAERETRFAESPTVEDALFLGRIADESERYGEAIAYFDRAIALDPEAAREGDAAHKRFAAAFFAFLQGKLSVEEAGPVIESTLADAETEEASIMAFARLAFLGVRTIGLEPMEPYLRLAYPRVMASENEKYVGEKKNFLLEYTVQIEKDPERGLALKRELLPEGWENDAGELNQFAWWCFENAVNLEEAEALARRGAELAESDGHRASILDTVAEIVNLRGDPAEAVRLIERAIELDTTRVYFREQLDRFQGIRDAAAAKG